MKEMRDIMDINIPKIDKRTEDRLWCEFVSRAGNYIPQWDPNRNNDAGRALAKIYFEKMFIEVQQRLNSMPEKNKIAFLNYLGIDLLPAQSAETSVVFGLVPGTPENVAVTAGFEITGKGIDIEGKEKDASFQTVSDLSVSPALLTEIYSSNVKNDYVINHKEELTSGYPIYPFPNADTQEGSLYIVNNNIQEHSFYIAHNQLLNISLTAKIILDIVITTGFQQDPSITVAEQNEQIADELTQINTWFKWEYFNGISWVSLGRIEEDKTKGLTISGTIAIHKETIGEIKETIVNNTKARWIRCRYNDELSTEFNGTLPEFDIVTLSVETLSSIEPSMLFANGTPLDSGIQTIPLLGIKTPDMYFLEYEKVQDSDNYIVTLNTSDKLELGDVLLFGNDSRLTIVEKIDYNKYISKSDLKKYLDINDINIDITEYSEFIIIDTLKSIVDDLKSYLNPKKNIKQLKLKPYTDIDKLDDSIDIYSPVRLVTAIRRNDNPPKNVRFSIEKDYSFPENRLVYFCDQRDCDKSSIVPTAFTASIISTDESSVNTNFDIAKDLSSVINTDLLEGDPLYLTPHIKPFGNAPVTNDIFYIANDEAFSKKNASVTISFRFALNYDPTSDYNSKDLTTIIVWEYWNGIYKTWRRLDVIDETEAFTKASKFKPKKIYSKWVTKHLRFNCPEDIEKAKVNGEEKYWIRARIVDGEYGKALVEGTIDIPIYNLETKEFEYNEIKSMVPGVIHYPIISSIYIEYQSKLEFLQNAISYNNADYVDITAFTQEENKTFKPFQILPYKTDALFLGFDKQLNNGPLRLYFNLENEFLDESAVAEWSYWNGSTWIAITINDSTMGLRRHGYVEFFGSRECKSIELFNNNLFWLKIEIPGNGFSIDLKFQGFFNAVDAIQSSFVHDEQLGASKGVANQTFTTIYSPIITSDLYVREISLSDEEKNKIISEEGNDAIQVIPEGIQWAGELWIRWHEVTDFDDTLKDNRHYIVDKRIGEVRFGDGVNGLIPPIGSSNIKITYRYGGGVFGNVPAGAITGFKTSIPFVSTVTNPFAAEGGAETQDTQSAIIAGAQSLKHQNRAVTSEDFELLSCQVSRAVARAKCLSNIDAKGMNNPGWISILIVPFTTERPPILKQKLITMVERDLQKICVGTIQSSLQLNVREPIYVKIEVVATLVTKNAEFSAEIVNNAINALKQFLDPITGGMNKTGWEFGGIVNYSGIITTLESIENVDYTYECKLFKDGLFYKEDISIEKDTLVYSGVHSIDVVFNENAQDRSCSLPKSTCDGFESEECNMPVKTNTRKRLILNRNK
jgi:hypothetical protein